MGTVEWGLTLNRSLASLIRRCRDDLNLRLSFSPLVFRGASLRIRLKLVRLGRVSFALIILSFWAQTGMMNPLAYKARFFGWGIVSHHDLFLNTGNIS